MLNATDRLIRDLADDGLTVTKAEMLSELVKIESMGVEAFLEEILSEVSE